MRHSLVVEHEYVPTLPREESCFRPVSPCNRVHLVGCCRPLSPVDPPPPRECICCRRGEGWSTKLQVVAVPQPSAAALPIQLALRLDPLGPQHGLLLSALDLNVEFLERGK